MTGQLSRIVTKIGLRRIVTKIGLRRIVTKIGLEKGGSFCYTCKSPDREETDWIAECGVAW